MALPVHNFDSYAQESRVCYCMLLLLLFSYTVRLNAHTSVHFQHHCSYIQYRSGYSPHGLATRKTLSNLLYLQRFTLGPHDVSFCYPPDHDVRFFFSVSTVSQSYCTDHSIVNYDHPATTNLYFTYCHASRGEPQHFSHLLTSSFLKNLDFHGTAHYFSHD